MASLAFALPITPGKTDEWVAWSNELAGSRREEYTASRRRLGLTGEDAYLQHTPNGDFAIIVLRGDNIEQSLAGIATSQEPFDVWFRQRAKDLFSGLDLSAPMPGPLAELIFNPLG